MKSTTLPTPIAPCFVGDTCIFMTRLPWTVRAWSLSGKELWQSPVEGDVAMHPILAPRRDDVWVASGHTLHACRSGDLLALDREENVTAFSPTQGGFVVVTTHHESQLASFASFVDRAGRVRWKTPLAPSQIAFQGMKPWTPRSWSCAIVREPIAYGEALVVVTLAEYSSGIGRRYALELATGKVVWTTDPGPPSYVTSVGGDRFLLGWQGYGAFELCLHDRDGSIVDRWVSDGYVTVSPGRLRVLEMENRLPSRMHIVALESGGTVRRGPHLSGFHTTRPAIGRREELLFYRDGRLLAASTDLELDIIEELPSAPERPALSAMHLTDDGDLGFVMDDTLVVTRLPY